MTCLYSFVDKEVSVCMFSISNDLLNSVDMQENINVLTVIDNNHR